MNYHVNLWFRRPLIRWQVTVFPLVWIRFSREMRSTGPMYFVFCRLYPFCPHPPWQFLVSTCHLSTLNYHCNAGARFRGTQKEDDRGSLSIQSSLGECVWLPLQCSISPCFNPIILLDSGTSKRQMKQCWMLKIKGNVGLTGGKC